LEVTATRVCPFFLKFGQVAPPLLSGDPVSFTYALDGESHDVILKNEDTFGLSATPEQLNAISFSAINGAVGVIASFEQPVDIAAVEKDANLSITRRYQVNGRDTTSFQENDIVKVILNATIKPQAIDSEYQISDYLPAGLKLLTNLASRNLPYDQLLLYPYEQNGQAVKFWSSKPRSGEYFYYATAISKGEFTAEAPKVQGLVATGSVNYGAEQRITIE